MSFKTKIDPLAKMDMRECIDWYDMQKTGLGDRLLDAIFDTLLFLEDNPYSFQVRYRDTRIAPVKKFPVFVHYIIDEKNMTIPVLAVLHGARNPKIWNNRK